MVAVILVEPYDPVNVSATARAMASFSAGPLIVVNPVFDIAYLDARISRGGTRIIDELEIVSSLAELKDRFDLLIATTGKPSAGTHLRTYLTPFELRERSLDRAAFVFGRESDGLRNEELELCDLIVSIETSEEQRALNLSHAVAVMLAITSRIDAPVQHRHPSSSRAEREALIERVEALYTQTTTALGTYREERLITQIRVWKRILARTDLSEQELRTLFGFITACEETIRSRT